MNDFDIFDDLLDKNYTYILTYDGVTLPAVAYTDRHLISWLDFIPEFENAIYLTPIGTPIFKVPKGTTITKTKFNSQLFTNLNGGQIIFINLLINLYLEGDD